MTTTITARQIAEFVSFLHIEERSNSTISKYTRDLRTFFAYMGEGELCKEAVLAWKTKLIKTHAPASVNSMLAAVNSFLEWLGKPQYKVKPIKIQRSIFTEPEKELSYEEYVWLIKTAEQENNKRLSLLLQALGCTGIRVSEVQFITVAAVIAGRMTVSCKGKTRIVFLTAELCAALKKYCKEGHIESGIIFRTKSGQPLDRSNIWRDMKALCKRAGVSPKKVFPHNLRHLFARSYYKIEKDLSRLADILGHSNVNTTRIYTAESGQVHENQLNRMRMIPVKP